MCEILNQLLNLKMKILNIPVKYTCIHILPVKMLWFSNMIKLTQYAFKIAFFTYSDFMGEENKVN